MGGTASGYSGREETCVFGYFSKLRSKSSCHREMKNFRAPRLHVTGSEKMDKATPMEDRRHRSSTKRMASTT